MNTYPRAALLTGSERKRAHACRTLLLRGASVAALLTGLALSTSAQAGDILRGNAVASPVAAITAAQTAANVQAQASAITAQNSLARTTQALQAMQAAQSAAHNLAIAAPSNVPNGLQVGGLVPDTGVPASGAVPSTWSNVSGVSQATDGSGQTTVTIKQSGQQALLNWQSFNVGTHTTVDFDQGGNTSWIAINRITDPTGVPSQILGRIKADGQVYLINPNGILFGGSSQINVNTLLASALPINDALVQAGTLFSNPDNQFTFSAYAQPGGSSTSSFAPPLATTASQNSAIVVAPGAEITTPTATDGTGGRVVLIGPKITNNGWIQTPDGQTVLAAGQQVALLPHVSSDPSLRGLDVYVGSVLAPEVGSNSVADTLTTGTAINAGLIEADRGDITLAGATVSQIGILASTTSVSLNGRIDLDASYNAIGGSNPAQFFKGATGLLTLGADSSTQILPELDSTATVVGTSLALPSQVNLTGLAIDIEGQVIAPSGQVTAQSGTWNTTVDRGQLLYTDGQIYVGANATIDVSGSVNVSVPVSQNIVAVQLEDAQLADSPLQRDGVLHGQTIDVDIRQTGTNPDGTTWIGTPLADTSGYVALIQRTVSQLTTTGGTIALNAGGSVVTQAGSLLNVSGGSIAYQSGVVNTTKLIGADGHIYNVSQASAGLVYTGIAGPFTNPHTAWGQPENFGGTLTTAGTFEPGYVQGADGGALSITAPAAELDGNLLGMTIAGPQQRQAIPAPSSFSLDLAGLQIDNVFAGLLPPPVSQDVLIASGPGATAAAFSLATLTLDPTSTITLSPDILTADGFGALTVASGNGKITVATALTAPVGGAVSLTGANIDIRAPITAPSGSISLSTVELSPTQTTDQGALNVPDATRGTITLSHGVTLSVAGQIVDDRAASPNAGMLPLTIHGGTVAITGFNVDLQTGSTIDVSAGLAIAPNGKQTSGAAGSVSIAGGFDSGIDPSNIGVLNLNATLKGYGAGFGGTGGSLSVAAPVVQIGGTNTTPGTLLLGPAFFDQGGFANFTLSGIGTEAGLLQFTPGVVIAPGTIIDPAIETDLLQDGAVGIAASLVPSLLPQIQRPVASLTLKAMGFINSQGTAIVLGTVVLGDGASIMIAPTAAGVGAVNLSGSIATVLGSIAAPGGQISISGSNGVDLGPSSVLNAAGTTVATVDAANNPIGEVLPGGSISVSGKIVAESGALLDVSGASGEVEVATAGGLTGQIFTPTTVDSDAGMITLKGLLFSGATLRGEAGGASAAGGSLSVTAASFDPLHPQASLIVSQEETTDVAFQSESGLSIDGLQISIAGALPSNGYFAADNVTGGGFDNLTLGGFVDFTGPVTLSANRSMTIATGGILSADGLVNLNAPHIVLGEAPVASGAPPLNILAPTISEQTPAGAFNTVVGPSFGTGNLSISASDLIDVGTTVLQGIGTSSLSAGNDIRGYGTFEVSGALTLLAGQIYPTTDTVFTIAAFDSAGGPGSVTINRTPAIRALPLSAGGQLNVFASTITQDGVLRAPLGTITLGSTTPQSTFSSGDTVTQTFDATTDLTLSEGSVTSVSAVDPLTGQPLVLPYGTELNGVTLVDPSGTDISISGAPQKAVNLSATNVSVASGATLDLSGGGDLLAYNFVEGIGGTKDILGTANSFAILPGYQADYAPILQITKQNPDGTTTAEAGWSSSNLAIGDQITLTVPSNGLAAGTYTLLPARYALLPGAFLVTPTKGSGEIAGAVNPDGSSIVPGYRSNDLNPAQTVATLPSLFEVDSPKVVNARAEYDEYSGDATLAASANTANIAPPRLAMDAGVLALTATGTMTLNGTSLLAPAPGGLGGVVSIASPDAIVINDTGTGAASNTLYLSATELSDFGAGSLLVGGFRTDGPTGTTVTPSTASIEVANTASHPLTGEDITLISSAGLQIDPGATIAQQGTLVGPADTLLLGDPAVPSSGNGALLRVSSDLSAKTTRAPASLTIGGGAGNLSVGAGAVISGVSVTLDSSNQAQLDPTAVIKSGSLTLGAGQISLQLDPTVILQPDAGLVLPGNVIAGLQSSGGIISFLSYASTIDIYGAGDIGSADLADISFHAGGLRGFGQGAGATTIIAKNITFDNASSDPAAAAVDGVNSTPSGTLTFDADGLQIGGGGFDVVGYGNVALNAPTGILVSDTGGFSTTGNLVISTSKITAAAGANQSIAAQGMLNIAPSANGISAVAGGLGASLVLSGTSIADDGAIVLPSGVLTLHATGPAGAGDLILGPNAVADVSGSLVPNIDQPTYAPGGAVTLAADSGSVNLQVGSVVTVAAAPTAGNAGSLSISAPQGEFTDQATLRGQAGAGGTGGSFFLDAGSLPPASNGIQDLTALNAALNGGGFTQERVFRVRTGDVTVGGTAAAKTFGLSADSGAITVSGTIDASGTTGGTIDLYAYNGVTLRDGALLTVAASQLDDAGKGGLVEIETGEAKSVGGLFTPGVGWIDLQAGSTIDLSVAGGVGGVLHLRAPQISGVDSSGNPIPIPANSVAAGTDLAIKPLQGDIINPSDIMIEGFAVTDLTTSGGVITSAVETGLDRNGRDFTANTGALGTAGSIVDGLLAATPNGGLASILHVEPGEEIDTLGSLQLSLNNPGNSIVLPSGFGATFATGTPAGDKVSFSIAGFLIAADGTRTPIAADTPIAIPAGATVALDGAGTLVFASGSAPVGFLLRGAGATSTGAGTSSTFTATTSGTGLTMQNSGSSIALPPNTAITLNAGLPGTDTLTATANATFTTTAGGTLVTLPAIGSTITLGATTFVTVPQGDAITSGGAFATINSGASVTLPGGKSITLPANSNALITIPTGATLNNSLSGATITATQPGSAITLNSAFLSTVAVHDNSTTLSFPNGTPGVDKIKSSVPATITAANGTRTTLAANTNVSLAPGSTLTLTGNANGGTVTFAGGSTVLPVTLGAGSFTISNNTAITAMAPGSTYGTNGGAATLTSPASSTPIGFDLPAGRFLTSGLITALPVGSTFSAGTLTLAAGTAPIPIAVSASTFTVGSGVTVTALPGSTAVSLATGGTLNLASGNSPLSLALPVGIFTTTGATSINAVSALTLPADWNLDTFRYGPDVTAVLGSGEPGVLTLRAAGDLIFNGSLSDGFGIAPIDPSTNTAALWEAPLLAPGSRSWSYRLTAGADFSGVDFHDVVTLTAGGGSLELGVTCACTTASNTTTSASLLKNFYQVIRTGTGDIDISASKDVQLLNQFATIYTAGSQVATATTQTLSTGSSINIPAGVPILFPNGTPAGDMITISSNGVETVPFVFTTTPASSNQPNSTPVLPANTVLRFPVGFSTSNSSGGGGVGATTANLQLNTPAGSVAVLSSGTSLTLPVTTSIAFNGPGGSSTPITVSANGALLDANGKTISTFVAGSSVSIPSGVSLQFSAGGTLSLPSGIGLRSSASLTLSAGTYTSNGVPFSILVPGSTLILGSAGQVQAAAPASFSAAIPLAANQSSTLLAGSSVALSAAGAITLGSGSAAITVNVPLQSANGSYQPFDTPNTSFALNSSLGSSIGPTYPAQFSTGGGNVTIGAGEDIVHLTAGGADDSEQELPTNWLYRRDNVVNGAFAPTADGDVGSTSWWVDYSNFFEGVGALGGGNVILTAGRDVKNVDAVVPTNAWAPYQTIAPSTSGNVVDAVAADQPLFQFGGGDLVVRAGRDINGGSYYVEKGTGTLDAGASILTNQTRSTVLVTTNTGGIGPSSDPTTWMPTALFLGDGSFNVSASDNIVLGGVANPFLLPMGENNSYWDRTYFTTYAADDAVDVSSLAGSVTLKGDEDQTGAAGTLSAWINNVQAFSNQSSGGSPNSVSATRPWLRLTEAQQIQALEINPGTGQFVAPSGQGGSPLQNVFTSLVNLLPPTLRATTFTAPDAATTSAAAGAIAFASGGNPSQGDIAILGTLTLAPSPIGTIDLLAAGSIDGLQGLHTAAINLSDANPASVPTPGSPLLPIYTTSTLPVPPTLIASAAPLFPFFNALFAETGSPSATVATQDALHTPGLLHANDSDPIHLYARTGDIADLTLFAGKPASVIAGTDITDIGLYLQNNSADDVSVVAAGRDITLYNADSPALLVGIAAAQAAHNPLAVLAVPQSGDISIGGIGTLEVLAGRNLNLGIGSDNADGTGVGIVSIGNARDPFLPDGQGANIFTAAGVGVPAGAAGLAGSALDLPAFEAAFLDPASAGIEAPIYLGDLGTLLGLKGASDDTVWTVYQALPASQRATLALDIFYLVLRDAGRDHNNPFSNNFGSYFEGFQAIDALFPGSKWSGDISLTSREIKTQSGGDINLLAPGGQVFVGLDLGGKQPLDQGILTLEGGNINIFTKGDVSVGTSRIFTFKGGNIVIWSSNGNIAAGAASKTLQSAPPARFLIDPVTGAPVLDLAGLATGGGIGVLQTLASVPAGDVDLIAPNGFVDAGEAGIRSSGNINIAALQVLNAANITYGGTATGIPVTVSPNIGALSAASNAAGAATHTQTASSNSSNQFPSVFTVEVIGYGGGDADTDDDQRRRRGQAR